MKLAFVSLAAPGHLNPMTTLARQMKTRGHDVVFSSFPDTEGFARAADLPFVPLCEKEYPVGSVAKLLEPLARLQGRAAMEFTFRLLADVLQNEINDFPHTMAACRAEAVVLDEADTFLSLVPMHLRMPYVSISNALPFDFSGQAPLCFFDTPFDPSHEGLARNREQLQSAEPIFAPCKAVGRAYAEKVGLEVDWTDPFATVSKVAWLTQMPKEFDFTSSHFPPQFHYTGPFHDSAGRAEADFPWNWLTGEPLIYASLGTLQNGLESVFSTIAEGVGDRSGMQLVLSVGPALDPKGIRSLPKNAIVVRNAPQVKLLERSALCVTHAGLNTALECLTQGVPMVAIPITNDQPGVAARIAEKKTGLVVPLNDLTASRLSLLVDKVLNDSTYRDNACYFQKLIAETNGLSKAADLLERAFGLVGSPRPDEVGSPTNHLWSRSSACAVVQIRP
jgi:zeaxanthin glucosyltransferase